MASYGWTLEEALALTFPQVRVLYRALAKWPTANLLAAGIAHDLAKKDPMAQLGALAGDAVKPLSKEGMSKMLAKLGALS